MCQNEKKDRTKVKFFSIDFLNDAFCSSMKYFLPIQKIFFAESMHVKHALPQAAQLSIFFCRKTSSVAPPQGT